MSGRPSTMRPPPTPTSPERNRTSSRPTAAPRRCSASAPRSASLATVTGTSSPSARREPLAERHVAPAEVRGHRDEPVAAPDDARDRDADADERPPAGADPGAAVGASSARSAAIVSSTDAVPAARSTRTMLEDVAAQPDDRGGERVDGDLEGEDDRRLGVRPDERRRPPGRALRRGPLLADEVRGEPARR